MKNILIIGGGSAGLSAAVTAAQAGAKVTVLEKRRVVQGNGRYAEGVFGAGSLLQKRRNIDADSEKLFRQAMEYSHWRADARLTRCLIERSGETVDWLTGLGVGFNRVLHHMPNQSPEVFHMASPAPTGANVMRVLEGKCRELGVEIFVNANVQAIIIEEGRAVGAIAEIEGAERKFEADAVLIATGGFAGNPEMMREMIPNCTPEVFMHLRGIPMTGDGVNMAKAVGAGIVKDIAVEGCGPVFGGRGEINALIRRSDCVWVNTLGQRFCDESICTDFIYGLNAVSRQPGKMCWAIADTDMVSRCLNSLPDMMAPPESDDNGMSGLYDALDIEISHGKVFKADTIEELAKTMGVDGDVLKAEIARYNSDCASGVDSLFCKDRRAMLPLETAPYYAVKGGLDILTTHGGIKIDSRMRVLRDTAEPIKGLFAAGIDVSGIDSGDYSVEMSGHAFGFSLTGGRIAAEEMLGE